MDGFPATRDSLSHLFRVWAFDEAMREGQLLPRWLLQFVFGYGYPLFNFYGPLLYYVAEVPKMLGADSLLALRFAVAASSGFAGLGAYLAGRRFTGSVGGLVTSAAYVTAPYFQVDLTVRGAFPELLGMAILPFAILPLLSPPTRRTTLLASIAIALLIFSHNAAAVLGLPVFTVIGLALAAFDPIQRKARVVHLTIAIVLGLGLSAFFWLPATVEFNAVWLGQQGALDSFIASLVAPRNLIQTSMYDYREVPGQFHQAGLAQVGVALAGAVFAFRGRRGTLIGALGLGIAFLMTDLSAPLWRLLPFATLMAFPWRMQSIFALTTALLAGWSISLGSVRRSSDLPTFRGSPFHAVAALIAIVVLGIDGLGNVAPGRLDIGGGDIEAAHFARFDRYSGFIGTTSPVQFLPRRVGVEPEKIPTVLVQDRAAPEYPDVRLVSKTSTSLRLATNSQSASSITLSTFDFAGWSAKVDGRAIAVTDSDPLGLITVPVPAGNHDVMMEFGDTPVRQIGVVLSILSVIGFGYVAIAGTAFRAAKAAKPSLRMGQRYRAALFISGVVVILCAFFREGPASQFVAQEVDFTGMKLLGYRQATFSPERLTIETLWQVRHVPADGWKAVIRLDAPHGETLARDEHQPWSGTTGSGRWSNGEIALDTQSISVPPGIPSGAYRLVLGWRSPQGVVEEQFAGPVTITKSGTSSSGPDNTRELENGVSLVSGTVSKLNRLPFGLWREDSSDPAPEGLGVELTWRPRTALENDLSTFVHVDVGGKTVAQSDSFPPLDLRYTSAWLAGRPNTQRFEVPVPALGPGRYDVNVGMYDRASLARIRFAGGADSSRVGSFRVQAPPPAVTIGARLEDVSLDGYSRVDDCGNSRARSCSIGVNLIWRALAKIGEPFTVFTHLVAADGTVVAQSDSYPSNGTDPTDGWNAGDTISDVRHLTIPANLAAGKYRLIAGMYRAGNGQRLAVDNDRTGSNAVEILSLNVP